MSRNKFWSNKKQEPLSEPITVEMMDKVVMDIEKNKTPRESELVLVSCKHCEETFIIDLANYDTMITGDIDDK